MIHVYKSKAKAKIMKIYQMNQAGFDQLTAFLVDYHKNAETILSNVQMLNAWALDAENSLSDCGSAIIEIRGSDSRLGCVTSITINPNGFDVSECE